MAGPPGAGSVFLGVVEDTARFLATVLDDAGAEPSDDALRAAVERAVDREIAQGRRVPGLGHPIHKLQDPRTPRIYEIASETGTLGLNLRVLRVVHTVHHDRTGRELPINGAGVAGAALADLGFPAALLRGVALLARTAGLVGHLGEEMERPIGMPLYREVDERAQYHPPRERPSSG